MQNGSYLRLAMLGAAPETRSSIAAAIDGYRAHGLFKRWPIDFVATHADSGVAANTRLYLAALKQLSVLVVRHRRLVVHLHTGAHRFLRDGAFMSAALAARCPLVLQLHGGGFERLSGSSLVRRAQTEPPSSR